MITLLLAVQDTVNQVIDTLANQTAPGVVAAPKELHFIDLLFDLADVYDDYEEFDKVFECLKVILEE